MAFTSNSGGGPMADINVTPLVDVMLVLLIIFMVTVPPLSYPIQVDLPQPSTMPPPPGMPPPPIRITIDAAGGVSWNGSPVAMNILQSQFDVEGARGDTPTGTIDATTKYGVINDAVHTLRRAGVRKVGFVSGPERDN